MSEIDDRFARLLIELEEEIPSVYREGSGSGFYRTVPEISDANGVYNASIDENGITLSYGTDEDVGRRVCAYVHEKVHEYMPELASRSLTDGQRAEEELIVEYLTETALAKLLMSDDGTVKVAAESGLDVQRRRDLGEVYASVNSTWSRYQSGEGGRGFCDTVVDKTLGAFFTIPEAAEKSVRYYIGGFLGSMGAPAVVDKEPKVAKATRAIVDAAYADYKKWAAERAAPAKGK